MANRLNVIYLPGRGMDPAWQREVVAAIGPRHDLTIYDETQPLAPQFADVDAVVDLGGSWGTREMLDAAPKVRFWQIMGTGMDTDMVTAMAMVTVMRNMNLLRLSTTVTASFNL